VRSGTTQHKGLALAVRLHESIAAALDEETMPLLVRRMLAVLALSAGGLLFGILGDAALGRSTPPAVFRLRVGVIVVYTLAGLGLARLGGLRRWSRVRIAAVGSAALLCFYTLAIDVSSGHSAM
jgi:hypothetical protein